MIVCIFIIKFQSGKFMYIADSGNNRIIKLEQSTYTTSVLAGTGQIGGKDDFGSSATFNDPYGLLLYRNDEYLLVTDAGGHTIRSIEINNNANVTTIVGTYGSSGSSHGICLGNVYA
jgi:DNA-binding beta-propeller fold protein YncE